MKQNDEIEDLFQSTFDDFSVDPPQNVKSSIDDALFNSGGKKNRIAFYFATFLIITSITGLILYNNSSTLKSSQKENRTTSVIKTNSSSSKKEDQKEDQNDELLETEATKDKLEESNSSKSSLNTSQLSNKTYSSINKSELKNKNISAKKKSINSTKNNSFNQSLNGSNSQIKKEKSILILPKSDNKLSNTSLTNSSNKIKNDEINKEFINGNPVLNSYKASSKSILSNTSNSKLTTTNSETDNNNPITVNSSTNKNTETTEVAENKNTETSSVSTSNLTETGLTTEILNNDEPLTNPIDQPVEISQPTSSPLWMLSIRSGSSFSSNINKQNQYKLQEKNAFFFNLESSCKLQNNLNLTSGFQYNKASSEFNYSSIYSQNVLNGLYDTIITYTDTANPTIADTTLVPQFKILENKYLGKQVYNQTSFSIPLYAGYSKKIFNNFYFDANAGVIFSYQQAKLITSDLYTPDQTIRNIGIKLCLRPQIRYQFGKFGVSLSSNFGYDIVPTLKWTTIPYKRIFSDFGVGIHYQF